MDPEKEADDNNSLTARSSLKKSEDNSAKNKSVKGDGKAASPSDLALAESAAALPGEKLGNGFKDDDQDGQPSGAQNFKASVKKNQKKYSLGTLAIVGFITLCLAIFAIFIPLKIEDLITNVENHFFASSDNAVSTETDNAIVSFFKDEIAPAMKIGNCAKANKGKTIISKDCTLSYIGNGNNPVTNLYKTWSQAKLENELSDKYGIELIYDTSKNGGTYYLKAPGISGEEKVGDAASGVGSDFDKADRGTVRAAFKSAESDLTGWDKVMFRYKVGRLLEEKYGIKRCIVFCGTRDALANKVSSQKSAAKLFLVERVITPINASTGALAACLFLQSCGGDDSTPTCAESPCDDIDDLPQTDVEGISDKAVGAATAGFGSETAQKLIGLTSDIREAGGAQNYIVQQAVSKTLGIDLSEDAADGIGIITTVGQGLSIMQHIGPYSKEISYTVGAVGAVSLFMMYRTYADEIHTGHVTGAEVGSFTDSLNGGNQCDSTLEDCSTTTQLGGTASAEQTPLYNSINNNDSDPATSSSSSDSSVSILDGLVSDKAYADSLETTASSYKCADGNPVPKGQLTCSEEQIGKGNNSAIALSKVLDDGPVGAVIGAFSHFTGVLSTITSPLGDLLGWLGSTFGVGLPGFITKDINGALQDAIKELIPSPFSEDMSGGRTYDGIAMGADVSNSNFAQADLGGQALSGTQATAIQNAQTQQTESQFNHESMFARMFSTSSPYSLVSKVALAMPSSIETGSEGLFSSIVTNPLGMLGNSFSDLFSSKVSADPTTTQTDPFNVTQYGYPSGSIPPHPKQYWDQNCNDNPADGYADPGSPAAEWASSATTNTDGAGNPENTSTDPCLLIETMVGSAGGEMNSNLLTSSDLADVNGSGSGSTGSGGTTGSSTDCSTISGNAKILCEAQKYTGIYYLSGGGHQGYSAFVAGCPDPSNPPDNQATGKIGADGFDGNPSPCALDCSGLVYVALDAAYNLDLMGIVSSSDGTMSAGNWKSIPISQAQPGDLVTRPDHVEIVVSVNGDNVTTIGSHASGQQIGVVTTSSSYWPDGAWTYVPGSAQ